MKTVWLLLLAIDSFGEHSPYVTIREPFEELWGFCSDCNPAVPSSPDPLVAYTWNETFDDFSAPQIYRVYPQIVQVSPAGAASFRDGTVLKIHQACTIRIDWQVERAGWMEVTSSDRLNLTASLSEYNYPYPGKTKIPKRYEDTYRLETNPELYEGIRYTWLFIEEPATIDHITLLTKVKPVNYSGAFQSSDPELEKTWYTGAYGVRLNMEQAEFNSVLVERGDRVAIQGDGHPTMSTALVVFAPYGLIEHVLNATDSATHGVVDENIMAYPLYWCLSVIEWYMATGNVTGFRKRIPSIQKLVDKRLGDFLDPDLDISWMGWDDVLGNGWCFHGNNDDCGTEAKLTFAALVIRVCRDFSHALQLAGFPRLATHYQGAVEDCSRKFRRLKEMPSGLGVHSATNAINGGVATAYEIDGFLRSLLSDSVTICSESQFNQYWILQGLGNAGAMEHALASIRMCWATLFRVSKGCFWENFSPDWISILQEGDVSPGLHSTCHPWSSGVTAWQTHVHAGLEPLLPGYEEYVASPYVSIRYPNVSATVPTPNGPLRVNATISGFSIYSEKVKQSILIEAPVPGYVALRNRLVVGTWSDDNCSLLADSVMLDGLPAKLLSHQDVASLDLKSSRALSSHFLPTRSKNFVFVRLEGNGTRQISATFNSCRHFSLEEARLLRRKFAHQENNDYSVPPFLPPVYPASVTIDRNRRGDGLSFHGRDGYILLGYSNGSDRRRIPQYVQNVSILLHGYPGWKNIDEREFIGRSMTNKTYLPNPYHNSTRRALGMVGHDRPAGGQVSNVNIEVQVVDDKPYFVSLYCVAKSASDRHAIRIMDLETKTVIAPSSLIDDYQAGVWWSLEYSRSVRVRLQDTIGVHVSAIAFRREKEKLTPKS